jgi:hypothetical protein
VANSLSQVDIYNSSVTGINDVVYTSGWVNDTWKLNRRLTLNLGARFEHYVDGWPEQSLTPNGHSALAGWTDPRYQDFIAPKTVTGQTVANTNTISPKVGLAYDLSGDNRTVLKAFYGLSRWNSADTLADQENPVGLAQLRYAFVSCAAGQTTGCDLNGNRLVDSPAELGAFQSTQGGGGFVRVDRDLVRPTSHEVSVNLEREIRSGLSGRASYVYKNMRNVWGEIDVARAGAYTVPFSFTDPGLDRVTGTSDDQVFNTLALQNDVGTDRVFTNTDDDADFHNVEFAVNRRFSNRWMMLTSFGHTWSTMYHVNTAGNASRPGIVTTTLPPGRSPVRQQRTRNVDAVELQDHRPLRDALGDWFLGIVEGAKRLQLRPHDERDLARRGGSHGACGADRPKPLPDRRDPRRARRQVVQFRPLRDGDAATRHFQPDQRRHGHDRPRHQHRGRRRSTKSRRF